MIKIIRITTREQVAELITEQQEYRTDLDRYRSMYVYRGEPNASFTLSTTLKRNCKEHQSVLEPVILKNFTKYAAFENAALEKSIWRQMILGQHHGLPTRLLDWSHSPLVALHFAVTETNMDKMEKHDCTVWRTDMDELHSLLPEKYQTALKEEQTSIFSVDIMNRVASGLKEYDGDMMDRSLVMIEPPSIDPRIISQYSFFSIIPSGMTDIEQFLDKYTDNTVKYIIDKDLKWYIRDMLDQLNISERTIYPGLDGLSKWLARHYYVKD